jgi:hypothetical protein
MFYFEGDCGVRGFANKISNFGQNGFGMEKKKVKLDPRYE